MAPQTSPVVAVFALASMLSVGAFSPPPDPALDCDLRSLLLSTAVERLPWSPDAPARVHDALRLGECAGAAPRAPSTGRAPLPLPVAPADIYVSAAAGNDAADGRSRASALRSLPEARARARTLRAASAGSSQRVAVEVEGTFHLTEPLALDTALDAHTTWRASSSLSAAPAVVSGGFPLAALTWAPSSRYPSPVLEAALPEGVPLDLYSMFDGDSGRRLPLAREPNADAETQMQPDGWALVRGNVNGSLAPPTPGDFAHVEVSADPRNSSVFPIWGRDFDPRSVPDGYVWFGEGSGEPSRYEGGRSHWANKTVDAGLRWNATGGVNPKTGLRASPFNASGWAARAPGRRAHVFHNGLWGSWVFDVDAVDSFSETMTFSRGGFQEGRGGGMSTQAFFVEGAAEALDAPAEWWVDRSTGLLHLLPNATAPPSLLVAPVLGTVLRIGTGAPGVALEGLTFAHTTDELMEPYTISSPGDWSVRRSAAVVVDGAAGATLSRCFFRRVNGNALLVTGNASNTAVDQCDFWLPGGCAIAVVGFAPRSDVDDPAAALPSGVAVTSSLFEGIGVLGKQTSALFVSLAGNVSISHSVLFSGPRAGINIASVTPFEPPASIQSLTFLLEQPSPAPQNDGGVGGHEIRSNVIFDWVRETQDHGPIS